LSKKKIVISGINMTEGGLFTILDNCLSKIEAYNHNNELEIIALVANKASFNYKSIEIIEFPNSKKSWFFRIYYEYFYFKRLSKKIKPDIWISLHDITPNLVPTRQFVYCHHPTVFFKPGIKEWRFDYKIGLFSILYKFLYQINIKKNEAVIVQQHWIKKEFQKIYNLNTIVVCKPEFTETQTLNHIALNKDKIHFFYPSFPRTFKNFELIFEAIKLLDDGVREKTEFHFTTIKNNSNRYAKHLYTKYKTLSPVRFHEYLSRDEVLTYYKSVDCILFPSKLETWGLPISEAKAFNKPMLLANLPYAKETVGDYKNVSFFDTDSPQELATLITQFVNKKIVFQENKYKFDSTEQLNNWFALFDFILKK
jgi:glycosyltransferase involved in cell wall biosynthesis